jgi:hypothetical protein
MKHLRLFEEFEDDNSYDLTENDVKNILDKNDISYTHIKTISEGGNGIAVDISEDKVLKITNDHSEYYFAKKLVGVNSPNLVKIFKVWKEEYFYCIVEEKLITELNNNIYNFLYYMHKRNPISHNIENVSDEDVLDYFEPKLISLSKENILKLLDMYREVYYECKKYDISMADFHGKNVGVRKSNPTSLVYFDISDPYNIYSDKI